MTASRPNIVLIMTDQQRFDTIGALGASWVQTPNLDRLVNEGVTFTDCHITAASCVPCRASFFKGYYPHTTGVLRNVASRLSNHQTKRRALTVVKEHYDFGNDLFFAFLGQHKNYSCGYFSGTSDLDRAQEQLQR